MNEFDRDDMMEFAIFLRENYYDVVIDAWRDNETDELIYDIEIILDKFIKEFWSKREK